MDKPQTITIHNSKSAQYREIHCDGASIGITPTGFFYLNFFAQRNAIPKGTIFELTESGQLGNLISLTSDSKTGIVREHEIGIYMDLQTCENLKVLLEQKITEFKKLKNQELK